MISYRHPKRAIRTTQVALVEYADRGVDTLNQDRHAAFIRTRHEIDLGMIHCTSSRDPHSKYDFFPASIGVIPAEGFALVNAA